eukprot:6201904-Pleurochrysis_carterae.AAC.2
MLEWRKTRRGAGSPKDCNCEKGARGARWKGHQIRGDRTGRGGYLLSEDIQHTHGQAARTL